MHIHRNTIQFITILLQYPTEEITLAAGQINAGIRQALAQSHLIDIFIFQLSLQFSQQSVSLFHQPLITAACIHIEVEIAAVYNGVGCIATCKDIHIHGFRTINSGIIVNRDVAHRALNHIIIAPICSHIHVSAQTDGQRLMQNAQTIEVNLIYIHSHRGSQTLTVRKGIEADETFQQCIITVNISVNDTISHIRTTRDMV